MTDPDQARARLVRGLRAHGCALTPAVVEAFLAVPRHLFLPDVPIDDAYADEAVPTQVVDGIATSSASQPSMMAIMLEQLAPAPGHRVLEIGAGTGYNAALLTRLVGPSGRVVSVDIDAELVEDATRHLAQAGVTGVDLRVGDGALGVPEAAPYDRVVLTVGSWDLRPEWVAQLAPGGRLLLPLTVRGSQLSVAFDLRPDGVLESRSVRSCAFIRLRGAGAGPEATERVGPGWAAQVQEGTRPDLEAVAALLDEPRKLHRSTGSLDRADVWDGLGLWIMLAVPGALRLLTGDAEDPPGHWLVPTGQGRATVAVAVPGGLAALVTEPAGVRAFGPEGETAVQLLRAGVEAWHAAGRPHAADLRILAVPAGAALPGEGAVVEKELSRLVVTPAPA
ncbi:methyltransferase domain-containing protein [Pseudonocardia kujensis]|uniref:methyltransferase domain-containing protein n=1 Tax=Pseudonocardia kujensis TaxID=1128675 RepID=UPI001E55FE22|nr:methyltransferase domain-containing protein [Pseudonocardia kujensis]MCE0764316.1 methyltransferase domain-containing protein [Pseudonocardia kujensis]